MGIGQQQRATVAGGVPGGAVQVENHVVSAVERPVVLNGQVTVRLMMNLSSSFDHRFVDGYDAAAMIQRIKELLEHPATIFLP